MTRLTSAIAHRVERRAGEPVGGFGAQARLGWTGEPGLRHRRTDGHTRQRAAVTPDLVRAGAPLGDGRDGEASLLPFEPPAPGRDLESGPGAGIQDEVPLRPTIAVPPGLMAPVQLGPDMDPAAGLRVGWMPGWLVWSPAGLVPVEMQLHRDDVIVREPSPGPDWAPRTLAVMHRGDWRTWLHDPHRLEVLVDDLAWFRRRAGGPVCVEVLAPEMTRQERLAQRAARAPGDRQAPAVDVVPMPLLRELLEVV